MKDFLQVPSSEKIHECRYFFILKDKFPVSSGHCLIVSKAVKETFFDLTPDEKGYLLDAIDAAKRIIEQDNTPDGYNIGMNCGSAAGQSVPHFHCHVIPRYRGDMRNPKGGVRYCIPEKGLY